MRAMSVEVKTLNRINKEMKRSRPNDAMSQWSAAASKRLDCRTLKKGKAVAEMKDLATVGLPQTGRLAPEVLGE